MTKVVNLFAGKPVPEVIDMLEDMLAKARSGEITGVAAGVMYSDDSPGTYEAGFILSYSLIGMIFGMLNELTLEIDNAE
jgi:hypothetical protein